MTTPTEAPALVDTNVLVYATDSKAPQHAASLALLDRASRGELDLRLTAQVVFEFVSVVTNPRRVANALTRHQAWAATAKFRNVCSLVHAPDDLVDRVHALAATTNATGAEVFDVAIAATALAASVSAIYTYDLTILGRVPGLLVKTP